MRNKFFYLFCFLFSLFAFIFPSRVFADYMLPYPSYMPGHKFYRVSQILDNLRKYWSWGTIASVKYHMHLSDKNLVEAKILFEYKQYLLATDALVRSNKHFNKLPELIYTGKLESKDMTEIQTLVEDAMIVHMNVLERLRDELPEEYLWTPEKEESTILSISKMIDESMSYREKIEYDKN